MIIYKVTNVINSKVYIGKTIHTLRYRMNGHYREVNHGSKTHFHNALRKYSKDDFTWEVICACESEKEMNDMEFHYIQQYRLGKSHCCYNITCGGDGVQLFGKDNGMFGRKHTAEVKEYLSKLVTGRKQSSETVSKRVEKTKGMRRSDSTKMRMSNTWEITHPDGTVEKIKNLQDFCIKNNLISSCMSNVADGKRSHHKKFKCKRIDRSGTNSRIITPRAFF